MNADDLILFAQFYETLEDDDKVLIDRVLDDACEVADLPSIKGLARALRKYPDPEIITDLTDTIDAAIDDLEEGGEQ